ncbi:histidinol-phosphate transaminase [Candidatus Gottesmanbacteria bacterium]|nr:histidinol-phosphate transaminase [Candidatus Gottesmanbacteria bacterium]
MDITKLIRKNVQTFQTYKPSLTLEQISKEINIERENILKLDSGENPYVETLQDKALASGVNFYTYPDPLCIQLREELSDYVRIDKEWILCGNGSDELINLLTCAFVSKGEEIIICPPTFPMYEFYGKLSEAKIIPILRRSNFSLDIEKIQNSISIKTKIVFIDSPGNPSSVVVPQRDIEVLLEEDAIIVSDEAYFEYCGKSALPLLKKYSNLVILRTFSKWAGLAGLRIGYLIARPEVTDILLSIKSPYNVNSVAQKAAEYVLGNRKEFLQIVDRLVAVRKALIEKLQKFPQLSVFPSEGAYILFKPKKSAQHLQSFLKKNGILVKVVNQPLLENCIRINIMMDDDAQKLTMLLRRYYENEVI